MFSSVASSLSSRRHSQAPSALALCLIACLVSPLALIADGAADHLTRKSEAEAFFKERVTPFIKEYCLPCHQNRRPTQAGVNFSPALKAPGHAAFHDQWSRAVARVNAHDMPPNGAPQPSDEDRRMFVDWIQELKYLSEKDPGRFVLRRLTKVEYGNTLRDLFGIDPSIADGLPDEVSGEGYLNSLSPLQLEQYLEIANRVLDRIVAPEGEPRTDIQIKLFGEPASLEKGSRATARSVARFLARKAYRRPAAEQELDVLLEAFDLGTANGLSYEKSLHLMLKAVLVSPQFLFITPAGEAESETGIVPLDDYQLASRLSYLLWSTMPDAQLMSLADHGALHEPKILEAQVKRLIEDPRSRALFDGFGAQWLGVGGLETRVFDPAVFPQMTPAMRKAMYDEARLFFESIMRENQSVIRFVDGDYTYLNETLATLYGLEDSVKGAEMQKVSLSDANRGGVLGMPGVLAATSFPNRTSPVIRGVWVLERVLGEEVPAAPPNVPALEEQDQGAVANLSLRERTELHRTNPVCANCHKILDPIGFGLENFDAIGRWREQDAQGQPIDAAGELPGGESFSGPRDLKSIIAGRSDAMARNLTERLLAYALGRRLEGYDEIVVDEMMQRIAADGYRMQTLINAVVTSYPFTHRRIEEERSSHEQKSAD